jgi:putative SOS response-associated peptidase YedK
MIVQLRHAHARKILIIRRHEIGGRTRIVCGRYVVKSPSVKLKVKFHLDDVPLFEPRYNVAPTQLVPAVRQEDGKRRLATLRWGLIPSWAKDANIG